VIGSSRQKGVRSHQSPVVPLYCTHLQRARSGDGLPTCIDGRGKVKSHDLKLEERNGPTGKRSIT
jgi:hypothetical protein